MVSTGVSAEVGRPRQTASKGANIATPSQVQLLEMVRGLGIETEDVPGFFAVFVLMLALVDASVISALLPLRVQLLPGLGILTEVVASYILAFVLYRLGELWDELWNRFYSPLGWLAGVERRSPRFVWLLPGGRDLDLERQYAQRRLSVERGVYAAALNVIRRSPRGDLVSRVAASRARSRLCRTLILPVLLIALVCVAAPDWNLNLAGLAALPVVLGLMVAFANERMAHERLVYAAVGDL